MILKEFFEINPSVAIAFSGGVDSAFLLYAAKKYALKCKAYYVKTEFQPEFEFADAKKLAESLGIEMRVIEKEVLADSRVAQNPVDRCYFCKKLIFSEIRTRAAEDGFTVLLDGTNASDDADDRPGMKALSELEVRSPLRECGLTKPEIRKLSQEAGLFTWNKPAYACLATRIPPNEPINREKLKNIEKAEDYLFSKGYMDFRVRTVNGHAMIEVVDDQWMKLAEERNVIYEELKGLFKTVSLSLKTR